MKDHKVRKALLLKKGTDLAGNTLTGPVLLPVITGVCTKAVKKGRNHQKMELTVAIPASICPDPDDVTWISPGPGSKVRNVHVVIEFEPGTFEEGGGQPTCP